MAIEKRFLIPIDAPIDEIWRYLTEEDNMKKWLANDIHLDIEEKAEIILTYTRLGRLVIEEGFFEDFIPFKRMKILFTQNREKGTISYTTKFTTAEKERYSILEFVFYMPDQEILDINMMLDVGNTWGERVLDLKNVIEKEDILTGVRIEEEGINEDKIELKIRLLKDPSTVWSFLTDPKKLRLWFEETEIDAKEGGKIKVIWDNDRFAIGNIIEMKTKEYITFTWKESWRENVEEMITWRLAQKEDNKTLLTCIYQSPDKNELRMKRGGWSNYLLRLATQLYIIKNKESKQ